MVTDPVQEQLLEDHRCEEERQAGAQTEERNRSHRATLSTSWTRFGGASLRKESVQKVDGSRRLARTSHHRAAWVIGAWSLADVSARFRNRWRFGAERGRAAPSPRAGRGWRGLAACGVWVVRRSRRRSSGPGQGRTRAGADAPRPWRARPGGPRCGPGRRS